MAPSPAANPMSTEQSALLAEFARACRAAARAVSLYPRTHPSIQPALSRVIAATGRLVTNGHLLLTVLPDTLAIDGRSPMRSDPAVGELAVLLHDRLVGALRIDRAADLEDWHTLLLLLARPPEELIAEGGIVRAWTAAGRNAFEIREIDYAEVLRERDGLEGVEQWDKIIALLLQGETLDEESLAALLAMLGNPSRFGELLERLQSTDATDATVPARVAALITLVQKMLEATTERPKAQGEDLVLQTAADAVSRLTPDMLVELVRQARSAEDEQAQIASAVVDRITDATVASFVANSVTREHGATERLAAAFEALVPDLEDKERLLGVAQKEAASGPLGREAHFEDLWKSASQLLTTYSDEGYVSAAYGRELSGARRQAVEVERVSDDPPERIEGWRATISTRAVKALDGQLLLDLLHLEDDPFAWLYMARIAVAEVERGLAAGDIEQARQLTEVVVRETAAGGRPALHSAAESMADMLASARVADLVVQQLRQVDDSDVSALTRLCHNIGPRLIKPLVDVLLVEQNSRAVRRLRDLLFGFGAPGYAAVEQLKLSSNAAVRRMAIELLRTYGGEGALSDLTTMLGDPDAQVQREAVRALMHLGSRDAIAALERGLTGGSSATILQELMTLRDERVVTLLCTVLGRSKPRGKVVELHAHIIDALGGLGDHHTSRQALREVLYRSEWWAPYRTATLRRAAAQALRRIGSPGTIAILEEAAKQGSRGVRNIARVQVVRRSTPRERPLT
jgi:HEAT repeat protein/PBS lyase HEAT-like repeat-containing protein